MKTNRRHYLLPALLAFSCFTLQASPTPASLTKEAREHAKALGQQLSSTLQSAIKQGGPVAGIRVCKEAAMPIAQSLSQDGWEVGRTSLRVRNPDNAPDTWEREQLLRFAEAMSASVAEGPLEATQWNEKTQTFRYMKAIGTGEVCTTCHGVDIAEPVKAAISQHYPEDSATGFSEGDLRGAFTLFWHPEPVPADPAQ